MTAQDTCALRQAGPNDALAMEQFLAGFAPTSMFLRSNLAAHGTEDRTTRHGSTFFLTRKNGIVTGVFGLSNSGFLMAQAPGASAQDWEAFAAAISGRTVRGMTGVPTQVTAALDALGLTDHAWRMRVDEPLYHLDLVNLVDLEDINACVRRPVSDEEEMLVRWYHGYEQDVGQARPNEPPSQVTRDRAARAIAGSDVMILDVDGVPVAMAGVNARVPESVQIGGVYTPPHLRGRGYARRALAGLLQRERQSGVTQSVLFANNAAAARAYEALGYALIGTYRVAILDTPQMIGAPS